jgi:hypothetical protein
MNGGNDIEVSMDDLLQYTQAMEGMLLDAFQKNELGDDIDITGTFFLSLKCTTTTPLFGSGPSRITKLGTMTLLYNLKVKHGLSNACFSKHLR